jgi:hypothetical protein
MTFLNKASLAHWSSHCLTNPSIGFKACRKYGLILQLELSVCQQGHLFNLVMSSSAPPTPLAKLGMSLELCNGFLFLQFLCGFLHSVTSFIIRDVILLFLSLEYSLACVTWCFSLLESKWGMLLICHLSPPPLFFFFNLLYIYIFDHAWSKSYVTNLWIRLV